MSKNIGIGVPVDMWLASYAGCAQQDLVRDTLLHINGVRERIFKKACEHRFGVLAALKMASECGIRERRMTNGDVVEELVYGNEILVKLTIKQQGFNTTIKEEYPEMPTKDVESIEVTVTKYKTKDGQVFEKEAKAEEHAAILRGDAKKCHCCNGEGKYDPVGDGRSMSKCMHCKGSGVLYRQEIWGPK